MFCSKCGSANTDGARYCGKCGHTLSTPTASEEASGPVVRGSPPTSSAPDPDITKYATGKSPVLALVLSIIPGVGQFYNSDPKKGLVMLLGFVVLGGVSGGLLAIAMWLWAGIDAYRVASRKAARW